MKIGIFTHPLGHNYGGILQAWAMQQVLKNRGIDVETYAFNPIQFNLQELTASFKRFILKLTGKYKGPILVDLHKRKLYNHINRNLVSFVNNNINIRRFKNINTIPPDSYDAIIVGSDQVWRDTYTKFICRSERREDAFLYGYKGTAERIAYAASLGIDTWEFNERETLHIREALKKFKAVSVRENSGVHILSKYVDCESQCVLDPTLLINQEEYRKIIELGSTNPQLGQNKVVTYILDSSPDKEHIIKSFTSNNGKDRLELNANDDKCVKIPVEDWLAAISNANTVITDSFHGCVFSIIFDKPLIFIKNKRRGNARFDSLIETFHIENNLVSGIEDFNPFKNYSLPITISEKLGSLRKLSFEFLDKSLNMGCRND